MRKKKFVFSTEPYPVYNYPDPQALSSQEPLSRPLDYQTHSYPSDNPTTLPYSSLSEYPPRHTNPISMKA